MIAQKFDRVSQAQSVGVMYIGDKHKCVDVVTACRSYIRRCFVVSMICRVAPVMVIFKLVMAADTDTEMKIKNANSVNVNIYRKLVQNYLNLVSNAITICLYLL